MISTIKQKKRIKGENNDNKIASTFNKRREYFIQAGVELNEIQVSEDVEKNSAQFGKLILESSYDTQSRYINN